MKKLYLFLFTMVTITTVSAQQYPHDARNHGNRNQTGNISMKKDRHSPASGYGHVSAANDRDSRYNEIKRQQEIERVNRDYNKRIQDYRNDRYMSQRERERKIGQAEKERGQKIRSFTGGAIIGALAGVVLGSLIAGR